MLDTGPVVTRSLDLNDLNARFYFLIRFIDNPPICKVNNN